MSYWSDKIIDEQEKERLTCLRCNRNWNIGETTIRIPGGGNLNKQRERLLKENSSCPNCGNTGKWYNISNNVLDQENEISLQSMWLECYNCQNKWEVCPDKPTGHVCPKCEQENNIGFNPHYKVEYVTQILEIWKKKGLIESWGRIKFEDNYKSAKEGESTVGRLYKEKQKKLNIIK